MNGAELPGIGESFALIRTPTIEVLNRFAAVNDEFVDIHMDDQAAREAGFDNAIAMGNLTLSWLHSLLRRICGDLGVIDRVRTQFRAPAVRDLPVTCNIEVRDRVAGLNGTILVLTLRATQPDGSDVVRGEAVVSFPSAG
jgi:acyl dehydratase